MRHSAQVWGFIAERLTAHEDVLLLTVVAAGPGSPGKAGFAAVVAADGSVVGTIGGGPMEQRLVGECVDALRAGRDVPALRTLQHRTEPVEDASGLVCGGWQQVAAQRLAPTDLDLARRVCRAIAQRDPVTLRLHQGRITFSGPDDEGIRLHLDPDPLALVVGGGQVGRALAGLLGTLDLDVILTDPVPQHGAAGYRTAALPTTDIPSLVTDPASTYAVVVAPTVEQDAAALAALLPLRPHYLGLLGTARKRREILAMLPQSLRDSFDAQRVRSPVGLPIGSHTPAEIAVSIAAQIISVRNGSTAMRGPTPDPAD